MKLEEFNRQSTEHARKDLFKCCGSTAWVDLLMNHFPFHSVEDLKITSDKIWFGCTKNDWLEAFSHHPKIGEKWNIESRHSATAEWANQEQSSLKDAEQNILDELTEVNMRYDKKFGYIFIVCATRKSAGEMLELLKERLNNEPDKEIYIAINEQNKITHLRIDKLFL